MIDKLSIYQKMMAEIEEIQKKYADAETCVSEAFKLYDGLILQATAEKVIGNNHEATEYLQRAVMICCLLKQIKSPTEEMRQKVSEKAKEYTPFENW